MNDRDEYQVADELDAFLTARLADRKALPPSEVELSAALADLSDAIQPDPDFAASLEARLHRVAEGHPVLLNVWQKFTTVIRRQMMHRRMALTLASLAALILLGLWGPSLLQPGPTTVSAAEVLDRANATLADAAADADVVYDRLLVNWGTIHQQRDVVAELWQSRDGDQFRYQLTDPDGNLLYFIQRDGDRLWRSFHSQPIGFEAVTHVYEMSLDQYQAQRIGDPLVYTDPSAWDLYYGDLGVGWVRLNRLMTRRGQVCADLYCLIGPDQPWEWDCDLDVCTLSYAEGQPAWQARLIKEEPAPDGRTVYVIELTWDDERDEWSRTLYIDRDSFALVEIVDHIGVQFHASLRHLERRALSGADWPPGRFSIVPQGLEILQAEQERTGQDRVWIISVSPEPGIELTGLAQEGPLEFEVVVGYELTSAPEASVEVSLFRPHLEEYGGRMIGDGRYVDITADGDQATVRFIIRRSQRQWMGAGDVVLHVRMGLFTGATSMDSLVEETFETYRWYMTP